MTSTEEINDLTTRELQQLLESARRERDELDRVLADQRAESDRIAADRETHRARVFQLSNQLTSVSDERDAIQARLRQATSVSESQLDAFKQQVAEVATRYAVANNWCSVVDSALGELGLERIPEKPKTYTATLDITVRFTAELASEREYGSRQWVHDSINTSSIEEAIRDTFSMDSDHEDSTIDELSFSVSSVTRNES